MAENMQFLPKSEVLSFEELEAIVGAFIARGVRKVRLTGGEPLVRRDIMDLFGSLSNHLRDQSLEEITLTTNGSQLTRFATDLAEHGVKRVNVSLDTLDPARFAEITRRGRLDQVLDGIKSAQEAGLRVKINMVAMRGVNDDELVPMLNWAHEHNCDLTFIEGMPLGEVGVDRVDTYLPLIEVRDMLAEKYTLTRLHERTGGPARYFNVAETKGKIGFITPMSHNFCESCNRVRLTCTGKLYLCLGQDDHVDLRSAYREKGIDGVNAALDRAMIIKPKGHDFILDRDYKGPAVTRHMSVTGG